MFFDAVYFFCFLFACGHVGFFLYGGVGVKYRYGLWGATHDNGKKYFITLVGNKCPFCLDRRAVWAVFRLSRSYFWLYVGPPSPYDFSNGFILKASFDPQ